MRARRISPKTIKRKALSIIMVHLLDVSIIIIYLFAMLLIGFVVGKKKILKVILLIIGKQKQLCLSLQLYLLLWVWELF